MNSPKNEQLIIVNRFSLANRFSFRLPKTLSVLLGSCCIFLGSLDAKEGKEESNRNREVRASGTSEWGNTGQVDWDDATNWIEGSKPTQYTDVKIDNGGTAVLDDKRGFYKDMTLGSGAGNSGSLEIKGENGSLRGKSASLGKDGGSGSALMTGGSWINKGDMNLGTGQGSEGNLTIRGGEMEVTENLTVGSDKGNGTVDISGGRLGVEGDLTLGYNGGTGQMQIANDARVDVDQNLVVGSGLDSMGGLEMSGGSLNVKNNLNVGYQGGKGDMLIENGARVDVDNNLNVGYGSGSIGDLEMRGGSLEVKDDINVGYNGGEGQMQIANGARVDVDNNLNVGYGSGSIGELEMSGGSLNVKNRIALGYQERGEGKMQIANDARVDVGNSLIVGFSGGKGEMLIENDARVDVGNNLIVGWSSGGVGGLEMSGGSLGVKSNIFLGYQGGKGKIQIANDARVDVDNNLTVGLSADSIGEVEMSGGSLGVKTNITLGYEGGKGEMQIANDARVDVGQHLTLGWSADSIGNLEMSGGSLNVKKDLTLGYDGGEGKMQIANDARVDVDNNLVVGWNSDSIGELEMNGGNLEVKKDLILGYDGGKGTLTLEGGKVSARDVAFGETAAATGSIDLKGGVLSTGSVQAYNDQQLFTWNGGTLQATRSNETFVDGFHSGKLVLGENGGTIDSNGNNIGINSEISGSGALTKEGNGMLTFTTDQSYEGPTHINQGVLELNVNLASSDVNVASNATLTGMGTVRGNVMNNGSLLPAWLGDSPDTFTIKGNYTQSNEGKLIIPIIRDNYYSKLSVAGNAQLDGAVAPELKKGYVPKNGTVFDILTATEGVQGEFSSVELSGSLQMDASYTDNDAKLTVRQEQFTGKTETQKSIAAALNKEVVNGLNGTEGALGDFIWNLEFVPQNKVNDYLDQLAPFQAASIKDILFNVANMQYGQITNRLANMRIGTNGFSLNGMNSGSMEQQIAAHEQSIKDKEGKTIAYSKETSPWSIFATASGIFSNMANVNDLPRLNVTTGLFSTGADLRLNEHLNAGIYVGYQGTQSKYGSNALYGNGIKYGLYGTSQWNGWYVNAIVGGGNTGYNMRRTIGIADDRWTARSAPSSAEFDSLLGTGYEWNLGNWRLGTNASLQYTYAGISGFDESGAGTLNVRSDGQNVSSLVSTLGANISYIWNIAPGYQIIPTIGMGWQLEYLNNGQNISAAFNNGAGPRFSYASVSGDRNTAFGTAGLSMQLGKRIGSYVYYTPQLGSRITSHGVLLGINYNF